MNIVDFIILAILIYGLLSGMYKGMIASGISLFGFWGAWIGAQSIYERISHFALSNTTLMAVLNQYLEPETFFSDHSIAVATVQDVIAGGEASISFAVNSVGQQFGFIAEAFSNNVRNQAFQNLGINTMADYFNQTLWVAAFNVLSFIAAFVVLYIVISLIVNMLDRVVSFPILRSCDWLVGGVFGLLRSSVVIVLVLTVLPALVNAISVDLTNKLLTESTLYSYASQLDLLNVTYWIRSLIMG